MFNRLKEIKVLKSTIDDLEKERTQLKREVEDLKLRKKIDEEDIKHMVKIKEERLDIEYQKKIMANESEYQNKLHAAQNEYRDKLEKRLEDQVKDIKGMYSEILDRLPNMNVSMKGKL